MEYLNLSLLIINYQHFLLEAKNEIGHFQPSTLNSQLLTLNSQHTKMENKVAPKSLAFAVRIVKLYKHIIETKKEFVLSKQMLRSGTAIGALIREAEHAQSKPDFLSKMNIALKEANETMYWLILLKETDFLTEDMYNSINNNCEELVKMLASIVKTTKITLGR